MSAALSPFGERAVGLVALGREVIERRY